MFQLNQNVIGIDQLERITKETGRHQPEAFSVHFPSAQMPALRFKHWHLRNIPLTYFLVIIFGYSC